MSTRQKAKETLKLPDREHDEFIRQQNERCFLTRKQKVKYHSFILLEILPFEKIQQLISGLDRLYAKLPAAGMSSLNYEKILSTSHSKLFQRNFLNLPYITTSKLKDKVLPNAAFHDLGESIQHMNIFIYKVLPSTVILQIQVYLDDKVSKKINNTIYKYHKEIQEPIETPKGKYTKIYGPENRKESEVYQLRRDLHREAVDFLNKYLDGNFFELSKDNISVVPSIDLFSLNYPTQEKEILDWGTKNSGFFRCFSTHIMDSFIYENYLLCFESKRDVEFKNYVMFANRKISSDKMYHDLDSAIKERLNFCSFDILAIDRWIRIQEGVVGRLNQTVSEEILRIRENNFSKAIETRKSVLKSIFSFQRFRAEYNRYGFVFDKFPFRRLKHERIPAREIELFKALRKTVSKRVKEIDSLINSFTRQYETILGLKNVEFSKKMQTYVLILTIIVIVLAIIQIIVAINPKISEFITRFIIKLLIAG